MASVLIVDDEEIRHRLIGQRWPKARVCRAKTVAEAQAHLAGAPFDVVYLDHHLGPNQPTGAEFVPILAALPPEKRPNLVVVHTWTPTHGKELVRALEAVGIPSTYEPFKP